MKKLMTMLAAVATAFGLFAATDAGFISGAGFDTSDADAVGTKLTWTTPTGFSALWSGTDGAAIKVETGHTGIADNNHPLYFSNDSDRLDDQHLTIQTTGGALVSQKIAADPVEIGDDGLYFDGLVQFTAFEDDMPAIDADAKIAVFPMVDDPEADTPVSHLIIKAFGTETNLWTTTKVINDAWHRVTIKMIKNIKKTGGTPQAGFVVFIDGNATPVVFDSEKVSPVFNDDDLTPEAAYYNQMNALFGSLIENTAEMTDVAFGGKGAIDEIAFTENAPDFAASPKFFKIGWNTTTVASVTGLSFNPQDVQVDGQAVPYTYIAQEGYISGTTNITGVAGETYTITAAKLGASVYVKQGDEWVAVPGGQVSTFADAFALVGTEGQYKIVLGQDEGAITIDKACDLTIDLAGYEIKAVAAEEEVDADAITVTAGALTIIDTVSEYAGKVTAAGEGCSVNCDSGVATITAGTYNGVLILVDDCAITGGRFSNVDGLEDYIPEDAEFAEDSDGYYFLQTVTDFTVEVPEAEANTKLEVTIDDVLAGMTNGTYTVAKDLTLKAVYTADTGYTLDGEGEFTIAYENKDDVITAPTATADEYTITIAEGGEGALATPATYTIESFKGENLEVTLDAGTAPTDKQFKAWTKNVDDTVATIDGDTLTILNGQLANITVTATWEDIAYVARVNSEKFLTTEAALAKVWELEAVPTFPITVTCLAADGFTVKYGDPEQSVTLAENETIVITADSWKFDAFSGNVVLAPGKTIKAKSIADGAAITTIPGYKVVKSDTTDEGGYYTWSVVAKTYVAQIVDGESFESFEEAVAALTADGQTIKLLDNTALKAGVTPAFNTTFDLGDCTLDAKLEYSITISAGKTLNLTNGTIDVSTKSYSVEVYGTLNVLDGAILTKDGSTGPVLDIYNGSTVNVYAGATLNAPAQQVFRFKNANNTATINIYGGTIVGNSSAIIDCYKDKSVANVTISGGTFTGTGELVKCGSGTGSYEGQTVTVNLAISGGDFTIGQLYTIGEGSTLNVDPLFTSANCTAMFSTDAGVNDCCADGYKAKDNGEGWYTIQAIQYATLAVTADEGITYTLTNKTTETVVEAGYKADIDNAEVIEAVEIAVTAEGYELDPTSVLTTTLNTATPAAIVLKKQLKTFAVTFSTNTVDVADAATTAQYGQAPAQIPSFKEDGTWDVNPATAVITCATNFNYTIKAEEPVEPVEPGKDIKTDKTPAEINDDPTLKAELLKAPEGATVNPAVYNTYFDAAPGSADGTVKFVLNSTGEAALQENVDDEIVKIKPDKIADGTATSVSIDPIPGFYYAIKQGNGIGTMKVIEAGVLAKSDAALELKLTQFPGAGFYKVIVSEKPIAAEK